MRYDQIVMLSSAGLICLGPFTLYLIWLGTLARRHQPTVVSGRWDFVGVVLALLGFLVFGGWLLLSLVHNNALFALRGNWQVFQSIMSQERSLWGAFAIGYVGLLLGLAAWEFSARRRSIVIYNITTAILEQTLEEFFTHLGRPLERQGDVWVSRQPLFRLDAMDATHAATLRWIAKGDDTLFGEVERHLRQSLPSLAVPSNPAALWIRGAAIASASLTGVCSAMLVMMTR